MNALIVSATTAEITPFLEKWRTGKFDDSIDIDVLITGVGLIATTYSLSQQIQIKRPDIIIQAGLGGSFEKNLALASVVVISQDVVADQGVIEKGIFKDIFDLGLSTHSTHPYKNGWLINNSPIVKEVGLKKLTGISVNEITASTQKTDLFRKKYNPVVESMEGAALHYVCLQEKIPFLQLRGISNYIGERDKKKWKIKNAILNLNTELIKILEKL